jgi:hypothetical protein
MMALLLMLTACAGPVIETTAPETSAPVEETNLPILPEEGEMSPTAEVVENPVENPITYFSMSLGEDYDHIRYLVAYEDLGETYLEYVGQEKKAGRFPVSLLHRLTEQVAASGAEILNGRFDFPEEGAMGSLYITYADGTYVTADFTGPIPEEFTAAYGLLDAWFAEQTAQLEVYVPRPEVLGDVDADLMTEITAILESSGMEELDLMVISDIPLDDYFVFTAGLSSKEGVMHGAQCAAMMMTTPYSFVIVTLRDPADIDAVREDFRQNLDWQKWVCVMPTDALIAQKGNMILCLMAMDNTYTETADAIAAAGWTEIKTLTNPEL